MPFLGEVQKTSDKAIISINIKTKLKITNYEEWTNNIDFLTSYFLN